jgi:branched-subunit amino acid transport protein AzlD
MMQTVVAVKWRILLKVLPFTLLFCLAKFLAYRFGWEVSTFDPLTNSVFGAITLVIAFVLAGTLSDFKTSEALPLEICSAIEGINDTNTLIAASTPDYDPQPLLKSLIVTLETIRHWLLQSGDTAVVFEQITELNQKLVPLNRFTPPPLMSKVQAELAKLRFSVMRIRVIRDTDFVISAYTLLQLYTVGAVLALLLIGGENFSHNLLLSIILITGIFYLLLLIQDLDNPFQYDGKSSVDVSLQDLDFTLDRLREQLCNPLFKHSDTEASR